MAYATNTSTTTVYNRAKYKPHDKTLVRVAKTTLNAAAGNVPGDQAVNCMTIPGGSVVLAVNVDVTTIEGAGAPFDVGFGEAGEQFLSNGAANTAGQTVCLGVPYLIQSDTAITITPDANSLANAVIDLYAVYVEFDSLTATN